MSSHSLGKNNQLLSFPLPSVRSVLNHAVQYQLIDHAQTDACKHPSQRRKL